jgi:hypothetical protein
MSTIGPVYPAQFAVSQAEVKLIADETDKANTDMIKSDQQRVTTAQAVETAEAKTSSVDFTA